jgi:hypothetical protein
MENRMMRLSLLAFAVLAAGSIFSAPASAARWCSVQNLGDLAENCNFKSRKQCQASLTGHTDFCRLSYGGQSGHRETYGSSQRMWR